MLILAVCFYVLNDRMGKKEVGSVSDGKAVPDHNKEAGNIQGMREMGVL